MARRKPTKAVSEKKTKKDLRQLVVTLKASTGEIEKIEELGAAGKRRAFSEAEFATLAGDSSLQDVCDALEDAYMAGIQDGFDDALCDDIGGGAPREERAESVGTNILRAGIRGIVFRQALRRRLHMVDEKTAQNGAHDAR
jgi:hypothetical protein